MTTEEIKTFRDKFYKIVWAKSEVFSQVGFISRLEGWNKGGSHDDAIKKAVDELKRRKNKLSELLEGRTYDDWRDFSKHLGKLQQRHKNAKNIDTIQRLASQIDDLVFFQFDNLKVK